MTGSPFLAYDIRGKVEEQLTEEMVYKIGLAYCRLVKPRTVVVGMDIRPTSKMISDNLCRGLNDGGADVLDIGLCGTEMVYFATPYLEADGGIMITASHNPKGYNGMKLVKGGAVPISRDNGLHDIRDMVERERIKEGVEEGSRIETDIREPYIDKVVSFLSEPDRLRDLKMVTDPGHGCAGPALDLIAERLDLDLVRMHHEPDGSFPAGVPNPILPQMRGAVSKAVVENTADAGIAWDGDFDRCFLFDEKGEFTEGYYIVGLLAGSMLEKEGGGKIIHDPRLVWNTVEIVEEMGGTPIMNKTGHAFIKDRMRSEDAVYGGEMSAHHYFRGFHYCDTGMIPWLLVMEMMAVQNRPLSELIDERRRRYPVSGEINRRVKDQKRVIDAVESRYTKNAVSVDHTDGVSIEHEKFRFNLRSSNTEPLIRLNVETRGNSELLRKVTENILNMIDEEAG